MLIFGDAISIFALNVYLPSGNSPFFILKKRSMFSSMDLSLSGEFFPGSVRVPLYSFISSGEREST